MPLFRSTRENDGPESENNTEKCMDFNKIISLTLLPFKNAHLQVAYTIVNVKGMALYLTLTIKKIYVIFPHM